MKNVRWIVLGYIMSILIRGCDNLIGSEAEAIGTQNYDRGCCEWNPIYVKVVD